MLLTLTTMYKNADLDNHPRMCVIFNAVSKFPQLKKSIPVYSKSQPQNIVGITEAEVEWKDYITNFRLLVKENLV